MERVGIVIANTGSPAAPTSETVADYLGRFLSDPRICPMNPRLWHFILHRFIIPKRAPVSAKKYASIWTDLGSPLDVGMSSLARKLQASFEEDPSIRCVRYAASYSAPSMEDVLTDCRAHGCDVVVVIPLYPQSALSTTEAVRDKTHGALSQLGWTPELRFVDAYCDEPLYIASIAHSILEAGFDAESGDELLFSFHSIPMADIRKGDGYDEQCRRTARRIAQELTLDDGAWHMGYQCRFDKSRAWLGPSAVETMRDASGARRLFVVAPNFSVDCLETLHDIQAMMKGKWLEGEPNRTSDSFSYVPCLNDSDAQVRMLHHIVRSSL